MIFWDYIGKTPDEFQREYIDTGLVDRGSHPTLPLSIYTYGRKAVHEDVWDSVTSRCRGILVFNTTGWIMGRPFEKFHNYGTPQAGKIPLTAIMRPPTIWEKMDGFLCTLYRWDGVPYIASKGSFTSIHAKWATAQYQKQAIHDRWPEGYTPVFEGLCPDLRIVVDYQDRNELVLLALINNETGAEMSPAALQTLATQNGFKTPKVEDLSLDRALEIVHEVYNDDLGTDEGFVLTWYRQNAPPFRLKLKYDEYCRLHRIVTGVSAKRIWEVLSSGDKATLDEWLDASTPNFARFAKKWIKIFEREYNRLDTSAYLTYQTIYTRVNGEFKYTIANGSGDIDFAVARKANGHMLGEFKKQPEELRPILMSLIDKDNPAQIIWSQVKRKATGVSPLVDAHNT